MNGRMNGIFKTKSMNGSDSSYAVIMIATDMVSFVEEDKPEPIERFKNQMLAIH